MALTNPVVGSVVNYVPPPVEQRAGAAAVAGIVLAANSTAGVATTTILVHHVDGSTYVAAQILHQTAWAALPAAQKAATAYWQWPATTAQGGTNS
jgi:hypothetical protein